MTAINTLSHFRIESRPEFAQILREELFGTSDGGSESANRINRAFDRLLLQSGTSLSGTVVLRLCLLQALTAGASAYLFSENLLVTALAVGVGVLAPIAVLGFRRAQRRARMSEQLPAVVEQLLRSARAGRRFQESFEQIAARTPAPLGSELRLALRRTQLGLSLGEALAELPERTGLTGLLVLVAAIQLSERQGGELAESLDQFARSLRERTLTARRLRETTVADWASGVLVFLLQALVVWLFVVADPRQLSQIATSRAGIAMIAAAGAILIAGWYCVLRLSAARRSV
jgi:tight adherence protein B